MTLKCAEQKHVDPSTSAAAASMECAEALPRNEAKVSIKQQDTSFLLRRWHW